MRENYRETEKAVLDAILGQVIPDDHFARNRERQNYLEGSGYQALYGSLLNYIYNILKDITSEPFLS